MYFFSVDTLKAMAAKAGFVPQYWETSVDMGGPRRAGGFIWKQVARLDILLTMIKRFGLIDGFRLFVERRVRYLPYGDGHTIVVVLRKQ
jgi:hypothetical protein